MLRPERSIILGSTSPRRHWLLEAAGFAVYAHDSGADETWPELVEPAEAVMLLADRKLDGVLAKLEDEPLDPVITADTVVFLEDEPLNKPDSLEHARSLLRSLSARKHDVITAFCVRLPGGETRRSWVRTSVWFRRLADSDIERYLERGESLDKAGAYGIQGFGATLVDRIEGSYTNVIGLPVSEVLYALRAST